VRAEATADVDFSASSRPPRPTSPTRPGHGRRSQQAEQRGQQCHLRHLGRTGRADQPAAGPGHRQIVNPAAANGAANQNGTAATPNGAAPPAASGNSRKDETINYEVDKTVRYTQQPMGGVRRLTVAVVVNYKRTWTIPARS
jgi:flagellar M-ring protein FliF